MIWFSRVLFLLAFALYWGGLTFYTGFVVRISHDVLSDPMDGGLITQRVTALLQILGLVTCLLMGFNSMVVLSRSRKFGYALAACTLLLGCSLIGLFVVHAKLDSLIDVHASEVIDRELFRIGHRRYNQLTTIQWLACLAYLPITVLAWRSADSDLSRQDST